MMIVPPTWSLPASLRARISPSTYGRQRAILEEGHLVLILHKPPKADDAIREGALFWRKPGGAWETSRPGGLKKHVHDYVGLEAKLTEQYERASDTKSLFELQEELTPVVRAGRNMSQALQVAREGVENDPFLIEMRDTASDVERNLDLLAEDVRQAIQYRTLREAEEQARLTGEAVRASHRLNILAALFLPLTAITSAFGMNLPSGMEGASSALFWIVLAFGAGVGLAMVAWVVGASVRRPK
ncbi:magnesium transporter CorA family protein [bacterium]|nr:MAG: magnesium transporter CorA family protein [bacterium]